MTLLILRPLTCDLRHDAWACLMTMPVFPTCAWCTGHGLQRLPAANADCPLPLGSRRVP